MKALDSSFATKCALLVLKIASRCNLNCTYCYMYNLGDNTYRNQPKIMSDEVVDALLEKVKNHCVKHGIQVFDFNFHGGEPLLVGHQFFEKFVSKANERLLPFTTPIFSIQTNGTLLDEEWCNLLGTLNIHLGISLDGTAEINDMYRIDHAGKGSYKDIIRGIETAMASDKLLNPPGLLSVINIKSDPVEVYNHFLKINPHNVDFLIPDANYDSPPMKPEYLSDQPYADWLIQIFDMWFAEKKPFGVNLFESLVSAILGKGDQCDILGGTNKELLVIETNGGIEPVGQLKICKNGFTKIGINVIGNELDEAFDNDLGLLFHLSGQKTCQFCKACPILNICGGGYLPHRFSKINGFNNPSVYCKDLLKLITHIQNKLFDAIPEALLNEAGVSRLSFENAEKMLKANEYLLDVEDKELELFAG